MISIPPPGLSSWMARKTSSTLSPIRSTGPTAFSIFLSPRVVALFDVVNKDVGKRRDTGLRDRLVVRHTSAFHVKRHGQVSWGYSLADRMMRHLGCGLCDGVGAQNHHHMRNEVVSELSIDRYWLRFTHGKPLFRGHRGT